MWVTKLRVQIRLEHWSQYLKNQQQSPNQTSLDAKTMSAQQFLILEH